MRRVAAWLSRPSRGRWSGWRRHGSRGLAGALLHADPGIDDDALLRHLNLMFIVGRETTATLVAWSLLEACDHPVWQERIAEEIAPLCAAGALTVEALESLPVTDAFVKEVGRLHSPVVNAPRVTTAEFTCGGVVVPAGHAVALAIAASHRSATAYAAPDRFLQHGAAHPRAVVTFATGARFCLGTRFAALEVKLVLARLLATMRIERASSGGTVHAGFWNGRPASALQVRLVPRFTAHPAA